MLVLLSAAAWAAEVKAVKVDLVPLADPAAPAWKGAAETTLPLLAQNVAYPKNPKQTLKELRVKALADEAWLVLRLEWPDPTMDEQVEVDAFTDAIAVEIPLSDPAMTSPMMGNDGYPVYVAHWKAVWQRDVEQGHADVQDYHPGYWADPYPFVAGSHPYDIDEAFQSSDARRYFPATTAGNRVAWLARRWPVEELQAEGFGSLADHADQDARAWGSWEDGRWVVLVALPREAADPANPPLPPGAKRSLAFAVWDGDARNVGGRKHWHPWVDLVIP